MPHGRNIVILLPHGLRSDAVGDSNAWPLLTPHMEKMAKHGLRLVATSACPADWGGMASAVSGLHARQHGLTEPTGQPEPIEGFPTWLAEQGYHLAGVGMVHSMLPWLDQSVVVAPPDGVNPAQCAYLQSLAGRGMLPAVQQQRLQRQRFGPFEPDRLLLAPDDDVDGFITAQARRLLTQMPSDKPWAMVVCFVGPACDLPAPAMYSDAADVKLLEYGFMPPDFKRLDDLAELDYPRSLLQRMDPYRLARIRADYLGRVCLIDFGIGRILGVASRRSDAANTWTILASDRGQLLGEAGLIGHRSFLAPAVQVPLIIHPPKPVRNRVYDTALVSTVDLAPTIAALGSADVPRHCVGRSLLPLIDGHAVQSPLSVNAGCLSEFGRRVMIETERHKCVFHVETHEVIGLYDLLTDPDEKTNLLDSPRGLDVADSMRPRLADTLLPIRTAPHAIPSIISVEKN